MRRYADNRVINMAVEAVVGIDIEGNRDILAIEPMQEESEATYKSLFDSLKARGLEDVWLVVSDAHKGLTAAIKGSFVGCAWQRCKVHFMRNILSRIPSKDKETFAAKLKQIWPVALAPLTISWCKECLLMGEMRSVGFTLSMSREIGIFNGRIIHSNQAAQSGRRPHCRHPHCP